MKTKLKNRIISGFLALSMMFGLTSGWLTFPVVATAVTNIEFKSLDMETGRWTVEATGPANVGSGSWVLAVVPNVYTGAGVTPEMLIALKQITEGTQTGGSENAQMDTALKMSNLPAGLVSIQSNATHGGAWTFDASGKHTFSGTFDTKTLEQVRAAFVNGYTDADGNQLTSAQITDLPMIAMLVTANAPATLVWTKGTMTAPARAELQGTPIKGNIGALEDTGKSFTSTVSCTGKDAELQYDGSRPMITVKIQNRNGVDRSDRFTVSWQKSGLSQINKDASEILVLTTNKAIVGDGPYTGVIQVHYNEGVSSSSITTCDIPVDLTVEYTYLSAERIIIRAPYGFVSGKSGQSSLSASFAKTTGYDAEDNPYEYEESIYMGAWSDLPTDKIRIANNLKGREWIKESDDQAYYQISDNENGGLYDGIKRITKDSSEKVGVTLVNPEGTNYWDTLAVGTYDTEYMVEIPYYVGEYTEDEITEDEEGNAVDPYTDIYLGNVVERTLIVPVTVIVEGNTELQAKGSSEPDTAYANSASYTWTAPTTGSETANFDIREHLGMPGTVMSYTFIGSDNGFKATHNSGAFTGAYVANQVTAGALTFNPPAVADHTGNCSALYRITYRLDNNSPIRTLDLMVIVDIPVPTEFDGSLETHLNGVANGTVATSVVLKADGVADVNATDANSDGVWEYTGAKIGTTYTVYVNNVKTNVTIANDDKDNKVVNFVTVAMATGISGGTGTLAGSPVTVLTSVDSVAELSISATPTNSDYTFTRYGWNL